MSGVAIAMLVVLYVGGIVFFLAGEYEGRKSGWSDMSTGFALMGAGVVITITMAVASSVLVGVFYWADMLIAIVGCMLEVYGFWIVWWRPHDRS